MNIPRGSIRGQKYFSWLYPLELKTGPYNFSWKGHTDYNVCVDYNSFQSSSVSQLPNKIEKIGFCDFQKMANNEYWFNGSGRSLFYKGSYIKGVGRTPMTVGWLYENFLHSNGIMQPTNAIREALFTIYAKKLGVDEFAIGLEDMRLGHIDDYSKELAQQIYAPHGVLPPDVDLTFIAQTQKAGNFSRYSNIIWLFRNLGPILDSSESKEDFFLIFNHLHLALGAASPSHSIETGEKLNFNELWCLLDQKMRAAITSIAQLNMAGLKLISLSNNFSIDGRFMDLEVPLFVGPHRLVIFTSQNEDVSQTLISIPHLIEALQVYSQLKNFIIEFGYYLQSVYEHARSPRFKTIVAEILDTYTKHFHIDHWIKNATEAQTIIVQAHEHRGKIKTTKLFEKLVMLGLSSTQFCYQLKGLNLKTRPIDFEFAAIEFRIQPKVFEVLDLFESEGDDYGLSSSFNEKLIQLDWAKDHESIFSILNSLELKSN